MANTSTSGRLVLGANTGGAGSSFSAGPSTTPVYRMLPDPPEGSFRIQGARPVIGVPSENIVFGEDVDRKRYLPLYRAAMKGEWQSAQKFIIENNTELKQSISIFKWTALHIACGQGHSKFVEQLVERMPREDLGLQDHAGRTALHHATIAGSLECVTALLRKNPELTQIGDCLGHVPLVVGARLPPSSRLKEVVWHLCLTTRNDGPHTPFASPRSYELMSYLAANEYIDVALYLVRNLSGLAAPCSDVAAGTNKYVLRSLILNVPSVFESQSRLGFWETLVSRFVPVLDISVEARLHNIEQPKRTSGEAVPFFSKLTTYIHSVPRLNRIYEEKSKHKYALEFVKECFSQVSQLSNAEMLQLLYQHHILTIAALRGIVEVFTTCFEFFPDAIWFSSGEGGNMLQTCVLFRQEKVFNFMLQNMAWTKVVGAYKSGGNTIFHIVAKKAPLAKLQAISGFALQMQSEIQWFKAVEKVVEPTQRFMEDTQGKTPQELFTEEHKELRENGEKWMKDTANSCMLVATLIATVVFAGAFTVPGGNNQETGIPIFLSKKSFLIFAIFDALALFSSSTSILIFLSILTSRFAEQDFLVSLPRRMIIGLASLFFAIVTMMVAFGATLSIVISNRFPWIAIPVTLLACIPVLLFVMLQLPLFIHMVKSTFWSDIPWR